MRRIDLALERAELLEEPEAEGEELHEDHRPRQIAEKDQGDDGDVDPVGRIDRPHMAEQRYEPGDEQPEADPEEIGMGGRLAGSGGLFAVGSGP